MIGFFNLSTAQARSSRDDWAGEGRLTGLCACACVCDTPSTAFGHLPPNPARFSYATVGALFISAQLSSDAVSALRKVPVLI